MRDLEIRGAGNLLGAEQSGHITAVGFELYCQLLKQSVGALKGEKVKPRVEVRVVLYFLEMNASTGDKVGQASRLPSERVSASREEKVEADSASQNLGRRDACPTLSASLPHNYVTEPHHRIEICRKLAQVTDKPALDALQKELRDRFGPLPPPVELLRPWAKDSRQRKGRDCHRSRGRQIENHAPQRFYHARRKIPAPHQKISQGAVERNQAVVVGNLILFCRFRPFRGWRIFSVIPQKSVALSNKLQLGFPRPLVRLFSITIP